MSGQLTLESVLAAGKRLAEARDATRAAAHEAQASLIAWVEETARLDAFSLDGQRLRPSYSEMATATGLTPGRIHQMVRGAAGRQEGSGLWRGVTGGANGRG